MGGGSRDASRTANTLRKRNPQDPPRSTSELLALLQEPVPAYIEEAAPEQSLVHAPPSHAPSSTAPSVEGLRVVSWNIGLHGLKQLASPSVAERGTRDVHGITRRSGFGSLSALLTELDADIVCLQEVKLKELGAPERHLASVEGWDSYFSLCRVQSPSTSYGRYAGVATFCRNGCRPRLAEEGLTGVHAAARGAVGHTAELSSVLDDDHRRAIDGEGRCVITVPNQTQSATPQPSRI
jgi:hypothetical protein